MTTYDGGASSFTGISPRRVRGVEVQRRVPVLPEPPLKEAPDIPDIQRKYLRWEAQWGGTFPEFLVFDWLVKKGLEPMEDFIFQSSRMGGRQLYGGAVVDFDFPDQMMAWRVQGEFFHIGNPAKEASDIMQKMNLTVAGYTVIDIFAQDIIERRDWVLSRAWNGEQTRSLHNDGG